MVKIYEDYLGSFVFKTAELITMKLFRKQKKIKKNESEKEEIEIVPRKDKLTNSDDEKKIEKFLDNLMKIKKEEEKINKDKENGPSRFEYDSLTEGIDEINFHFTLFFLLVVLTLIGIPSSITWAKNYNYSTTLAPDPLKFPATVVLVSLGLIWQLQTPRNV